MALVEPPVTDNSALNFSLSNLTQQTNRQEDQFRELLTAIKTATSLSDLQEKIKDL